MYFTDRGIEELDDRRGADQVSISWLAGRLRDFVDEHPEAEATIDSLASWLARLDEDDDDLFAAPAGEPGTGAAAGPTRAEAGE
jgi:hypothetical protein